MVIKALPLSIRYTLHLPDPPAIYIIILSHSETHLFSHLPPPKTPVSLYSVGSHDGLCNGRGSYVAKRASRLPRQPRTNPRLHEDHAEQVSKRKLRTGPKLEIPGYGCRDHQREGDIFLHRWAVLAQIISDDVTKDSLVDLGMRSRHRNVRHHCRTCTYKCVLFIRLKISLANNGPVNMPSQGPFRSTSQRISYGLI